MPEARHNDLTLYYDDCGSGPAVLLIHGHTLDHRIWDGVVPSLTAAGLRVLRPDLRGHGRSRRPDRGYHWSDHAADMVAVLEAAGVERSAVVGYSLGGGIALEMALSSADRLDRIVLLSPVMPDRPYEPAFFENLREVARSVRAEGVTAAMLGPWLRSPLWSVSSLSPSARDRLVAILRDFPGADYLASERDRLDRSWEMPDRLAEIEVPTLVAVGERELPGFRRYAEEAAEKIEGGRLVVLEGRGHLHLVEAPDEVAALLLSHIATAAGRHS